MASKANMASMNVYKKPLYLFSKSPMTGFYRDGFCRVGPEDSGNHSVAAVLTDEFLDFTASKGNNLRAAGLSAGCKWCLCAGRWKEAMKVAESADDPIVPKVFLHTTSDQALNVVDMADLKKFAADAENTTGTVRRGAAQNPPAMIDPDTGGTKGHGGAN